MSAYIRRFSPKQRLEHLAAMAVFIVLVLTGLPQKFFTTGWADAIVGLFGGVDPMRRIHRTAGVLLAASTVLHFASAIGALLSRRVPLAMIPTRKDFEDAVGALRFYLGTSRVHPQFDRFDYRQKFEYWGLVMGNLIMIGTGFLLIFPVAVTKVLPGVAIAAARIAHSNEGLMAFLVITIWHIYNSVLAPEVFPFDAAIFTGRISRERMEHEHPLELARIEGTIAGETGHGVPMPEA
ncbi:MAG TPA: cytochrome b/b6 domain-containing protein [Anaeromyxobacteraceae bacterium]|nr:cytochrome b/b6 domain-containing protein [Anaeromyxobacteraceae bacterium]